MTWPTISFTVLLIVQALHLLHHRAAKRHISYVEGITAVVLCVPLTLPLPGWLYVAAHLSLAAIQIIGSVFIDRLSPEWAAGDPGI